MKPVKRKKISIRQKAARETEEFLKLAGKWEDDRSAEEIIADIKNSRTENSKCDHESLDFDS